MNDDFIRFGFGDGLSSDDEDGTGFETRPETPRAGERPAPPRLADEDEPSFAANERLIEGDFSLSSELSEEDEPSVSSELPEEDEPDLPSELPEDDEPALSSELSEDDEPSVSSELSEDDEPALSAELSEDDEPALSAELSEEDEPSVSAENRSSDSETSEKPEGEERAISSDLIRGHINTIILRSLYDGDKYGYEIIAEIERKSHNQYSLKQPSLYSALKRLEKDGYITSYWGGSVSGGRRKYFSLTDEGKEIAERNQTEWEYSRTVIDSLISDKDFDFGQPAPAAVDMRVLKQSTSRVPERGSEEDYDDFGYDEDEPPVDADAERARYEQSLREREEVLRAREEASARREQAILEREFALREEEERREQARLEAEQQAAEQARLEAEQQAAEQARLEAERQAAEQARLEAEQQAAEQARLEAERQAAEQARLEAEQQAAEQARLEAEQQAAEQARLEAEQQAAEQARLEAEQQAAEQARLEAERQAAEQARLEAEQQAAEQARLEAERQAAEQAEIERARAQALLLAKGEQNARIVEMEPFAEEREHYERMLREQEEAFREQHKRELAEQEARIREEEERRYREREQQMIHQNYLNLVNGAQAEEPVPDYSYYYGGEQPTDSIVYVSKPENEREYRSIIRKLYAEAIPDSPEANIAPQPPVSTPKPADLPKPAEAANPELSATRKSEPLPAVEQSKFGDFKPAEQPKSEESKPAPKPVSKARSLDGIDFYDLESRAAQDGIRISTSGGRRKEPKEKSESLVHKGRALFFSALVVFLLCVAEGSIALGFQKRLSLPPFYPYFIWGTGLALLLVTGLLYVNRYGERALRQTGNLMVNVIVSYALCIIVILIVALARQIDFTDGGALATYIIFPAIYFFSVIVFGVTYYLQIRPTRED